MQSQRPRFQIAAATALAIPALAGAAGLGNPPAVQARQVLAVTAYLPNGGAVTPINAATNTPGRLIRVPGGAGLTVIIAPPGPGGAGSAP